MDNSHNKKPPKKRNPAPLLCWDIYSEFIQKLYNDLYDKTFLTDFFKKKKISMKEDFPEILKKYDAIVLTDNERIIQWVSQGFITMTGYSVMEVIGKKPNFLQGKKTDADTLTQIRKGLLRCEAIKTRLINYKKSGKEYMCEVCIEPVFDRKDVHTGFIAFEKEVKN